MFSKIYFKVLAVTILIIAVFAGVIVFYLSPQIEERVIHLEEKTGKAHLQEITTVVNSAARELNSYELNAITMHKEELRDVTEVASRLVEELYKSSQPEQIREHILTEVNAFRENLLSYYDQSQQSFSPREIKKIIKDFVKLYRYDSGTGYFFINHNTTNVLHPIKPELEGRDLVDLQDSDGKYFIREFARVVGQENEGFCSYKWLNPTSNEIEEKLTYIFKFPPFDWIIGTGFYLPEVKRQKQKEALDYIANLRYGDNEYFFVSNYDSVLISHPTLKGRDMRQVKDPKGILIVPPMVKVAREHGQGFHSYSWSKLKAEGSLQDKGQLYEKLTFTKDIKEWQWVIGTGIYLDQVEHDVARKKSDLIKNLRQLMLTTRIGKTGYIFIFDSQGNMIIHLNSNIEGTNTSKLKNPGKSSFILDDLVDAYNSGVRVLYYKWDKPEDKGHYIYEKVSWIDYNKDFNWYICSSAYISEINSTANQIRQYIGVISFVLVLLALLISVFLFRKMFNPIETLSRKVLQVKNGDLSVRSEITTGDEVGTLALMFDEMLDTIEDNITTLDNKVNERTRDLNEQKEVFETLFYHTADAATIIKKGKFIDCNQAALDMIGCDSREEFLNSNPFQFATKLQPDGQQTIAQADEMVKICLEKGFHRFEWVIARVDGSEFWASVTLTRIRIKGENLLYVVFRDISEARKIKDELFEAKIKAEAATQSKSEFLANMSHEIRTPMNGIMGMTHLILQTALNEKQRNFLQKIESSSQSLLEIINDILDFSKIEAGKLEIEIINFDLFEVIDTVVGLVEFKTQEKQLELIVSYGSELGRKFRGDPLRISQILTNLIGNAVKFTEYGEIAVYVQSLEENRVRFEVRDTGIGMSVEMQAKLFHSFAQADGGTSRKYGGTGLGLAISKQLVELMGGTIRVDSKEGQGSSFIFELELVPVVEESVRQTFSFAGKRVLIVDDNSTWQKVLENLLHTFAIEVTVADSGQDAVAKLNNCRNNPFDLILMDWHMPGLDGIETTRLINRSCVLHGGPPPTVIMVSAFRQESIVALAKEVGIHKFIPKPVNPSVLQDLLCEVFVDDSPDLYLSQELKPASLKDELMRLQKKVILLAEDNTINQDIIIGLLDGSGITVDIVSNGRLAVKQCREKGYDLILMDLQMPVLDGYAAAKLIREFDQEIPVIALTANAMAGDVEKTHLAGMNEHLNKPVDVEKLYAVLLHYLAGKPINRKGKNRNEAISEDAVPALAADFKLIDTQKGLSHLVGNVKLYKKILQNFVAEFKGLEIDLQDQESARTIHTLKGLSGNIGAAVLQQTCRELEEHWDAGLLPQLYEQLQCVIAEIEHNIPAENSFDADFDEKIEGTFFTEKIADLKVALARRRSRECVPLIEEIKQYQLSSVQKELLLGLDELIQARDFKAALTLLEGDDGEKANNSGS